ncbi:FAD-dependent oxidoreductase [Loigolactobacillus backii]|uniref:Pyridine nucleotide-disulfide oxidoreductase n=1 Tax=Loigolactobacillus backii TaxID=375175 RepID=A0A192H0W7_9LACO|nr:FAD-dependent oxidoreductase [Loigolactobacillus backii]ANK62000.1 pyridine nucleotide-disulfide oxidoreductase [Loigolactobacillus backii]ANK65383.1 pyridine nucleotide-disulfide oxidoreductase [Loigolactobacillus backii]ANK67933.1 pyridine nucleotide-disulfide oxidoreductase [Loigolactobacillus backii]ANK68806.1 pyridine nucleotide-disulfide oxidoreductase [Loigolactobacillus backii]MDA5386804.1 FAD-dependent oxidoreductase [Loigolactobacillus backii]
MGKKIVIVGGVAGGASVAARVRRLDETAEITMFEKGPNVSFSNCALPYYLSGTVKNAADIVLMTPEKFQQRYNINARTETEVIDVDPEMQIVTYINQRTGKQAQQSYDELFLAPGATPILPQTIKGITNANVFTVRNVPDIEKLQNYLVDNSIQKVTVIGGGFIGLEIAENLIKAGRKVALIEATSHVMQPLDEDMAQILHKELVDNGVNLIVSDAVTEISKDEVTLKSGKKLATEAVVAAIGVQPEVTLAKKIGVHLGETGAIAVNHHYQTNLPHVYAVGDAIEVTNMLTRKKQRLDLAFPAQMEARHAADHIYGRTTQQRGVLGSQVIRLFNLNAASTGLTEKQCDEQGIEYSAVTVIPKDKVALMPNVHSLFLKLVFGYPTGEILGAQAIGMSEVDKQINVIATAITLHAHVEDLQDLELCYQPLFSTTKNAVNFAGLVATNILNGEYKQVPVSAVRQLVKDKAFIIDARERDEYAQGHVKGAVNIPLSEFRDRLSEVPKDQPVYVHCLTSLRSYNMVRALVNLGYTNVHNIVGSFLGISEYNYYHDLVDDRESIVDHYKFDLD